MSDSPTTPASDGGRFGGPGPDAVFREALLAGRLSIQRCKACGSHVFFPRVLCTACGSASLDWVDASGLGTVYSTTVIRRSPKQGGDYNIVLVDLDEGPRAMSRVEGVPPAEVRIGQRVRFEVLREGEEPLLVFRPVEGGAA